MFEAFTFIRDEKSINRTEIANAMWPDNKHAKTYMSKKMKGHIEWTDKDEKKAREVLALLGKKIDSVISNTLQ